MAPTHILVVDDDDYQRKIVRRTLERKYPQVQIEEADSKDTAMSAVHHQLPDVVFTDYTLPGGDGVELVKQMQAEGYNVPVVMRTTKQQADIEQDHNELPNLMPSPIREVVAKAAGARGITDAMDRMYSSPGQTP